MVNTRDLAVFYRTLGQLLGAGVIGSEALRGCAGCLPEAGEAADRVAGGETLSSALARFPRVFPREHLHLIRLGEASGFLDVVLEKLADYAEEAKHAARTLRGGLALPATMLGIAAFVLPIPALVLGGTVLGYLASVLGFLAVPVLGIVAVVFLVRRAPLTALDAIARRIPVVREAWRELDLWRITSCLRMFTRTAAGLPEALRFAAGICRGPERARALRAAADAVEQRGEAASRSLRASGVFPREMMTLWANGENSGQLDQAFARLAERFAGSFKERLQALARLLPWIAYGLTSLHLAVQIMRLAASYTGYLNQP